MANIGDIGRQRLVRPAIAAEHKPLLRQIGCDRKKEFLDAPLAIRQAVGDQSQIAGKSRLRRHREVGRRIEAVVDRRAASRTEALISRHHRRSAAIGQDHVISRDQLAERILGICPNPIQRGRGVNVPEHG